MLKNYKLKLIENNGSIDSPRFSISYRSNRSQPGREISYAILSALKGENDLVIEINSSLFLDAKNKIEIPSENFLNQIRTLDLEYTYRKIQVPSKSFLFQIFGGGKKTEEGYEILAYVPHHTWIQESFLKFLPVFGARYYILESPEEGKILFDKMNKMTDVEKAEYFKLIIFDVASFSQMGIISKSLNIDDIRGMLEIG